MQSKTTVSPNETWITDFKSFVGQNIEILDDMSVDQLKDVQTFIRDFSNTLKKKIARLEPVDVFDESINKSYPIYQKWCRNSHYLPKYKILGFTNMTHKDFYDYIATYKSILKMPKMPTTIDFVKLFDVQVDQRTQDWLVSQKK